MSHQETPDNNKDEKSKLTPWQLANQEYLKMHPNETGDSPAEETDQDYLENEEIPETPNEKQTDQLENTEAHEENVEKEKKGPVNGSFLDRLPNIRHERNKRLYRRSSTLILLFMIPALVLLYYVSPLSRLSGISIEGNEQISSEEITNKLNFSIGSNLWSQYFNRDEHVTRLKKQELRIQDAKVHFNGINKFAVDIKEYKEVAYLEHDNNYSPILANGRVIPTNIKKDQDSLPILEGFTGPKRILAVMKQYDALSEEVRQGVSQIKYAPTNENKSLLQIFMNDGNQVLVSIQGMSDKMKYYPQVVEEMNAKDIKGIVDMEAGIYSYPYPEESSSDNTEQSTSESTVETTAEETSPSVEND
ncbi:cell division protein FtsQ/DivIB [Enterococcus sp. AZ072]|uniref:cell division protein FtsQ/DivIB n=1 Tax=unclassified Enterococcus TaxID=2608891 RepID=UPI003D2E4ED5